MTSKRPYLVVVACVVVVGGFCWPGGGGGPGGPGGPDGPFNPCGGGPIGGAPGGRPAVEFAGVASETNDDTKLMPNSVLYFFDKS